MTIPSGSNTEVLKRTTIKSQVGTTTSFRFDGTNATVGTSSYAVPTNFIITVLSVTICNTSTSDSKFRFAVNNGSTDIYLLFDAELNGLDTFVFSDKLILQPADKLWINRTAGSGTFDCICSYIVQNYT